MSILNHDILRPKDLDELHKDIALARRMGRSSIELVILASEPSEMDIFRGRNREPETVYFVPQLHTYEDDSVIGRIQADASDKSTDVGGARITQRASGDSEPSCSGELLLTVVRS